jgi:hypothetical protein
MEAEVMPVDGIKDGRVFEALLRQCAPFRFSAPWRFLVATDCFSTIPDAEKALAFLKQRFSPARLVRSGVAIVTDERILRLNPALSNPVGIIIALRLRADRAPFMLLTSRGVLPSWRIPAINSLNDRWTADGALHTGILVATFDVHEVAILRALGFAATLATGLTRLRRSDAELLNSLFTGRDIPQPPAWRPGKEQTQTKAQTRKSKGLPVLREGGLSLALMGWSLRKQTDQPHSLLGRTAAYFKDLRRHLGLLLPGIEVWQIKPRDLENLRFRLRFRDTQLLHELLWKSSNVLDDLEALRLPGAASDLGTDAEQFSLLQARQELLAALADDRDLGRMSDRVRWLRRTYESRVHQDLIAPLLNWALASDEVVVRNAGTELAEVCAMLHGIGPSLYDLLCRQLEGSAQGIDVDCSKILSQYLRLGSRQTALQRDLILWKGDI